MKMEINDTYFFFSLLPTLHQTPPTVKREETLRLLFCDITKEQNRTTLTQIKNLRSSAFVGFGNVNGPCGHVPKLYVPISVGTLSAPREGGHTHNVHMLHIQRQGEKMLWAITNSLFAGQMNRLLNRWQN